METLKRPTFKKAGTNDFYRELQREVSEKVLSDNSLYRQNIAKAVGLLTAYTMFYASILLFGNNIQLLFLFYMLAGVAMMTLFINGFHDAVHGALFKSPRANFWFSQVLALFGSNTWLWTRRHIGLHHLYPSIQHWDVDIRQSDVVRLFPHSPWYPFHRYQHQYMWLIYPFYSLNWIFIRDFKDFFRNRDNYIKRITAIPKVEYYKLFAAKFFNIFYLIVVPILILHQPWYIIISAWLSMHVTGSIVGVIALISTHVDEDAEFPMPPEDGKMDVTWAMHQMRVTKDFSTASPIANFLYGGFTHHVAHHLFPNVAHTYYPKITPIIRDYAEKYDLPYTCYPFYEAVRSHYRLLRNSGRSENILAAGEI